MIRRRERSKPRQNPDTPGGWPLTFSCCLLLLVALAPASCICSSDDEPADGASDGGIREDLEQAPDRDVAGDEELATDSGEPDDGRPPIVRGDAALCGPWPSAVAPLFNGPAPPPGPARLVWIHASGRPAHAEYPLVRESSVSGPAVLGAHGELCAANVGNLNNPGCIGADGRTTWMANLPRTSILAGPVTCPDGRLLWQYGEDGRLYQAYPGEEAEWVADAWEGVVERSERLVVGPAGTFAFTGRTTDGENGIQCRSRCGGGLLWQAPGEISLIAASSAGYYLHYSNCVWLVSAVGEVRGSICPSELIPIWPVEQGQLLLRAYIAGGSLLAWTDQELTGAISWQSFGWTPSSAQGDLLAGVEKTLPDYTALLSSAFVVRRGEAGCSIPLRGDERSMGEPILLANGVILLVANVGDATTYFLRVSVLDSDCSLREELQLPDVRGDLSTTMLIAPGGLLYLLGSVKTDENLPTYAVIAIQTSYSPATAGWSEPRLARSGTPFGGAASWDIYLADQPLQEAGSGR
ncbi:MAG: hypothetical protein RBU45_22220 [Myxococcota bacterium]|nr:hypothetical protein [Myxococcota bacterium]